MPTFAEHLSGRLPTALRGRWGAAYARILGASLDLVLDGAKDAVKAGFVASAPVDALPYLLSDAGLEALPGESTSSQRARVAAAFETWELAGLYGGITLALGQLGLTSYAFARWPEYAPSLPPDGDAARWATWLCTIDGHPYTADGTWADAGTWDDGGTWDSTATVADVARIRRLMRAEMGATHRGFMRFVLVSGVDFWGPATPWDHGTWTASTAPTHFTFEV